MVRLRVYDKGEFIMETALIEKYSLNQNINSKIKEYESNVKNWDLNKDAKQYYIWFDRFNKQFFNDKLEQAVISFEPTRINNLGYYHTERNGIGIQDNINLNYKRLFDREKWQVLSTLLHEMVHQYQRRIGGFSDEENRKKYSNYHNKEFLSMTKSFGLIHNKKGHRIEMPKEPFISFLKKHNIEITKETFANRATGKSKLKKFSCQCDPKINIRVANSNFSAKCNLCDHDFEEEL